MSMKGYRSRRLLDKIKINRMKDTAAILFGDKLLILVSQIPQLISIPITNNNYQKSKINKLELQLSPLVNGAKFKKRDKRRSHFTTGIENTP
jgi:hypothetical protein